MSLKELEKDIQSHDSKAAKREHGKTAYNEWQSKEVEEKESAWQKMIDKLQDARTKSIVIGGIIIAVIIVIFIVIWSVVFIKKGFFDQERVLIDVNMVANVKSNELVEVEISYENNNRAELRDVEMIVHFGEYFVPAENQDNFKQVSDRQGVITIGKIKGKEENAVSLAGFFVGPSNAVDDIGIMMRYVPERTSTRYEKTVRATTNITSSPVTIDIQSSQEVVSGNLMNIVVGVQNSSDELLQDLKLVMNSPESFSFYNSEPRANYGNVWLIDKLEPQSERKIIIRGGVKAPIGSVQKFEAELGTQESSGTYISYAKNFYSPRIVKSPVTIQQVAGGADGYITRAGDVINYRLIFKNDSSIALRDAIVTLNLDGNVLNYSELDLRDIGDFDQENNRIIWKASDVPALQLLEPRETGEIIFTVPVVEKLPVVTEKDHHFTIKSIASIDSDDIPSELRENKAVLSNVLAVPVAAKVLYNTSVDYVSGASPLQVGEETVYMINAKVTNINNDISNTHVRMFLPTHTKYKGSKNNNVIYNERTNEIEWSIGEVVHGAGIIEDAPEMSFNVSVVPSVEQLDEDLILIKEQSLSAKDDFTGVAISQKRGVLATDDVKSAEGE